MTTNKVFKTNIILNWKNGKIRLLKKASRKLGGSEVSLDMTINVEIPDEPKVKTECYVKLGETKVGEIVLDGL